MHALALALSLIAAKAKTAKPKVPERPYQVSHYALALALDSKSGAFQTTTVATVVPSAAATELAFDAQALKVISVKQGEVAQQFEQGPAGLRVKLAAPTEPGKPLLLTFTAEGQAQVGGSLGLIRVEDPEHAGRTLYYSMLEPDGARRIFPCDDRPADKASFDVAVTTDAKLTVISNGTQTADEKVPEGQHTVRWSLKEPQSTYLLAIAVGAFAPTDVPGTAVPARLLAAPGEEAALAYPAQVTQAALGFFADFLHTPYPWARYDQVAIPEFPWHGMENTTATFLRASTLVQPPDALAERNGLARLIEHELAHQWFGDSVTPSAWHDVWLNEAFATYLAHVASTDLSKNDAALIEAALQNRDGYFRFADGPRSRALVSNAATDEDVFDAAAYTQGAAVLRMLESLVGRDTFRKGLQIYLAAHAHGTATSADLFAAVASASGKDLGAFEKAWLHQPGYPVLQVSRRWLEGQKQLLVMLQEKPNKGGKKAFWPAPLTVVAHRTAEPAYHLTFPVPLDQAKETVPLQLPAEPEWIDWNQGDVVLARIEAEEKTEALAKEALLDPDPLARLWADLQLAGTLAEPDRRDPKPPSAEAMAALAQALGADHSPYVRAAVLKELARNNFSRLPQPIAGAVLTEAVAPKGLPDDALGRAELRKAGYAAMGKVEDPAVPGILAKPLADPKASLDLVAGAALGLGHRGDPPSVAALAAALTTQGARGLAYLRAVLQGLAMVPDPSIAPTLYAQAKSHHASLELVTGIAAALRDNRALLTSTEGTQLVGRVASDAAFDTELRARWLDLLDEVKTPAAKAELTALAKSGDARIAALAKQKLKGNFGR